MKIENSYNNWDWLKLIRFKSVHSDSDTVYAQLMSRIKNEKTLPATKNRFVRWKYRVAATFFLLLSIGSLLYYQYEFKIAEEITVYSNYMNFKKVVLPDNSEALLGSNSSISYPKEFVTGKRVVKLEGQCFFKVTKDARRPFVVQTAGFDVKVLGTEFEVFSYKETKMAETILLNGKVEVTSSMCERGHTVTLKPNEKVTLNKENGALCVESIDANNSMLWRKEGTLVFQNEPLSMIIPRLEQWFGCKITYPQTLTEDLYLTLKVKTETIEEILTNITLLSDYRYKKNMEGYELY